MFWGTSKRCCDSKYICAILLTVKLPTIMMAAHRYKRNIYFFFKSLVFYDTPQLLKKKNIWDYCTAKKKSNRMAHFQEILHISIYQYVHLSFKSKAIIFKWKLFSFRNISQVCVIIMFLNLGHTFNWSSSYKPLIMQIVELQP